jgi:hypothetical protein
MTVYNFEHRKFSVLVRNQFQLFAVRLVNVCVDIGSITFGAKISCKTVCSGHFWRAGV